MDELPQVDLNIQRMFCNPDGKTVLPAAAGGAAERTVVLCDRRALTLQCLARSLAALWPELQVYAVTEARGALDDPAARPDLDLAVVNAGPSGVGGDPWVAEQIDWLRRLGIAVVLIADREDVASVAEAFRAGVRGYIPSNLDLHLVVGILQLVSAGGTYMPALALEQADAGSSAGSAGADRALPLSGSIVDTLTPKETEILRRLKDGKPNKIIAYELDICESTVKVHMRQIMRKLSATNRTQAALIARQMFAEAA
jgi:DNA-binding NarL/FixJ family response regulator